jgi:hypothetical protein
MTSLVPSLRVTVSVARTVSGLPLVVLVMSTFDRARDGGPGHVGHSAKRNLDGDPGERAAHPSFERLAHRYPT